MYDSNESQGNVIANKQAQDLPEPYADQTIEKHNRIQTDIAQAKAANTQRSLSSDSLPDVPAGRLEITCTAYQKGTTYGLGSVNAGGVAVTPPVHTQGGAKISGRWNRLGYDIEIKVRPATESIRHLTLETV